MPHIKKRPELILFIFLLVSMTACRPSALSVNPYSDSQKRTVTFMPGDNAGFNTLERAIAACFIRDEKQYFAKYVVMNYDSVKGEYAKRYAALSYWDKSRLTLSRKRSYRFYSDISGTDHLMSIEIKKQEFDTVMTPGKDYSLAEEILLGKEDEVDQTLVTRKTVYKLRYVDGHTGKTLWSMRLKYPPGFMEMGNKHGGLTNCFTDKFRKKFPYKTIN